MPVDVEITFVSAAAYGGSPLSDAIAQATETLGGALLTLSVRTYVVEPEAPEAPLAFGATVPALPRCRWFAKSGRLSLQYATRLAEPASKGGALSPSAFRASVGELASQLEAHADGLLRKSLDVSPLVTRIRALEARVPQGQAELSAFLADAYHARQERHARLPWWDQLDVRWQDWHASARGRLDDRLFWEEEDEAAPHGNDTGSDVLHAYRRRRARSAGGVAFLDRLFREWNVPTGWRGQPPERWTEDDETWIAVWDQAAIALAFAQVKLDGGCEEAVRALGLEALDREIGPEPAARFGRPVSATRTEKLRRMRAVLAAL